MASYTNLVIKKSSEMYELGGVLAVFYSRLRLTHIGAADTL
jgi:hypothetical protein